MSTAFVAAPAVVVPEGAQVGAVVVQPSIFQRAGWAIADAARWIWSGLRSGWTLLTRGVSRAVSYTKVAAPAAASQVAETTSGAVRAAPAVARRSFGWLLRGVSAVAMWIWNLIASLVALIGVAGVAIFVAIIGLAVLAGLGGEKYNQGVHRRLKDMSRADSVQRTPWWRGRKVVAVVEEPHVADATTDTTETAAHGPSAAENIAAEPMNEAEAQNLRRLEAEAEIEIAPGVKVSLHELHEQMDSATVLEPEKLSDFTPVQLEELAMTMQLDLPEGTPLEDREEAWKAMHTKLRKEHTPSEFINLRAHLFGRQQAARLFTGGEGPQRNAEKRVTWFIAKAEEIFDQRNDQAGREGDPSLALDRPGFYRGVAAEVVALRHHLLLRNEERNGIVEALEAAEAVSAE